MKTAILCAVLLATGPCDWFGEDREPAGPPIDAATREQVVAEVLRLLGEAYAAEGPRFHARLPEIKTQAVKASGFADWAEFRARLSNTDPGLDIEISRRITARMRELLSAGNG